MPRLLHASVADTAGATSVYHNLIVPHMYSTLYLATVSTSGPLTTINTVLYTQSGKRRCVGGGWSPVVRAH